MKLRTRLQLLERRATALPTPRLPEESPDDDEFLAWYRGGCLGPLPLAGPRPAMYRNEEEWQQHRRYLLALCCREVGRPDPTGMSEEERREVDETIALVAYIDWTDQQALKQQACREFAAGIIKQLSTDFSGGTVSAIHSPGESP